MRHLSFTDIMVWTSVKRSGKSLSLASSQTGSTAAAASLLSSQYCRVFPIFTYLFKVVDRGCYIVFLPFKASLWHLTLRCPFLWRNVIAMTTHGNFFDREQMCSFLLLRNHIGIWWKTVRFISHAWSGSCHDQWNLQPSSSLPETINLWKSQKPLTRRCPPPPQGEEALWIAFIFALCNFWVAAGIISSELPR